MKELKFLREREQFVYTKDDRRGPGLAAHITDLLEDGRLHAFGADRTGSDGGLNDATCLFFTEDVLNLPDNYRVKDSSRSPEDTTFMKLPFEFEGKRGDCGVTSTKVSEFAGEQKEWLKENLPEYFSNDPNGGLKRGFFSEEFIDKLTERLGSLGPDLAAEQVGDIMKNSQLSQDAKAEKLFGKGRKADYVSLLNFLCFRGTEELVTHGYLSEKGLELLENNSLENSINTQANQIVRHVTEDITGPFNYKTLFYHSNYYGCRLDLEASGEEYVISNYDSSFNDVSRGYYWYKYIKYTIEKFEETGWFQPEPEEAIRGFFNEKLNEEIDRNFTSDSQISDIMDDPELTPEEKSYKLFNRDVDYVEKIGKFSYSECVPFDLKGLFRQFYDKIVNYEGEHSCNPQVSSVLIKGNQNEPFTFEESGKYYVKGEPISRYGRETRAFECRAGVWGKYIKGTIEIWEDLLTDSKGVHEYLPVKRGFFTESLEDNLGKPEANKIGFFKN